MATKIVRFHTVLGSFDVELFDEEAPSTVDNFLNNYVLDGDYDGSVIHRRSTLQSSGVEVIQGGGFVYNFDTNDFEEIRAAPVVVNEFDPAHSNLAGTIAMARPIIDPNADPLAPININSASNQWFFNLTDANAPALDAQLFTVFGRVLDDGMDVILAIAELDLFDVTIFTPPDFGETFAETPLLNEGENAIGGDIGSDLVIITSIELIDDGTGTIANPEPTAWLLGLIALAGFLYVCQRKTKKKVSGTNGTVVNANSVPETLKQRKKKVSGTFFVDGRAGWR